MSEEDVVNLMSSAKSPDQWNEYADLVKASYGNAYPDFWFSTIILSGVHASTQRKWVKRASMDLTRKLADLRQNR